MNYFPCNESADVIIDGVSHKGKLKLKNEYIPFCCPEDIAKAVSTDTIGSFQTDGCVSIGGKLMILSRRGSNSARTCYITTLQNNLWSVQQRSVLGLYNRIGVGQKAYCIVNEDVYVSDIHSGYAAVNIDKVNDDGTTTRIATTPDQQVYGGYIASFVNSNGDNCIAIANSNYKDRCYYYNLNTQEWTKFTLQLPSGDIGDIYSSAEENVIFCISSNGKAMYKYDFSSNTYTNISNWGELAGNQDKVGRVDSTNWRIPIICDKKVYHFLECRIAYNWNSGQYWGYKNSWFILDENGNVIFVPRFKYGDAVLSVCAHDNCIYFLCDETYLSWYENSSTTNYLGRGKFYKFDPKTRRMYDMSIPHLVIGE